jgi:hypothetical protein
MGAGAFAAAGGLAHTVSEHMIAAQANSKARTTLRCVRLVGINDVAGNICFIQGSVFGFRMIAFALYKRILRTLLQDFAPGLAPLGIRRAGR